MKPKVKKEVTMKVRYFSAWLSLSVLLSACAAVRGGGDVEQGRQALLAGNYQAALGNFQNAEQADPNYIYGAELREGVSSFLGRAQYLTGNYAQARQTLEKALSQHRGDNLADVPWPYVVSSGRPKGGSDEYPTGFAGNL